MTTKPRRTRRVKAWAVITNGNNELTYGDLLEQDADCACRAFGRAFVFRVSPLFKTKSSADEYCTHMQKAVPVTITYTLPKKRNAKKV